MDYINNNLKNSNVTNVSYGAFTPEMVNKAWSRLDNSLEIGVRMTTTVRGSGKTALPLMDLAMGPRFNSDRGHPVDIRMPQPTYYPQGFCPRFDSSVIGFDQLPTFTSPTRQIEQVQNFQNEQVQNFNQDRRISVNKTSEEPGSETFKRNWKRSSESETQSYGTIPSEYQYWDGRSVPRSYGTSENQIQTHGSECDKGSSAEQQSNRVWSACRTDNMNTLTWSASSSDRNSLDDSKKHTSKKHSKLPRLPRVTTTSAVQVSDGKSVTVCIEQDVNRNFVQNTSKDTMNDVQQSKITTNEMTVNRFIETPSGQQNKMEGRESSNSETSSSYHGVQNRGPLGTSPIRLVFKSHSHSRLPDCPTKGAMPRSVNPDVLRTTPHSSPAISMGIKSSGLTPKLSDIVIQASVDRPEENGQLESCRKVKSGKETQRSRSVCVDTATKLVDYGLSETDDSEEDGTVKFCNQENSENWNQQQQRNREKRKIQQKPENSSGSKKRCSSFSISEIDVLPPFIGPIDTRKCIAKTSVKKSLEVPLNDNDYLQEHENRLKQMKESPAGDRRIVQCQAGPCPNFTYATSKVRTESKENMVDEPFRDRLLAEVGAYTSPQNQTVVPASKNGPSPNLTTPFWATCESYSVSPLFGNQKPPPDPAQILSTWYSPQQYAGYGYTPSSSPSMKSDSSIASDSDIIQSDEPRSETFNTSSLLPPRLRFLQNSKLVHKNNASPPTWQHNWKAEFKEKCHGYKEKYIDSHCHLDFLINRSSFKGSWSKYMLVNSETFPDNYEGCVAVFCCPGSFRQGGLWKDIALENNVWLAFGCHPKSATEFTPVAEEGLKQCLKHNKVVALGEIGLDYSGSFRQHEEQQKTVFRRQIQIALDINKPLVIHCRDAEDDCLEILTEMVPKNYKIHCHCFTGDYRGAERWISRFPNLYIGLTPVVTYKKAVPSHNVARFIPLEKLLLETDAPYFIPRKVPKSEMSFSHPGMAVTVAEQVAYFKGCSVQEVLAACRQNTRDMYGI